MVTVEITGAISSGKSTIIGGLLGEKNILGINDLIPINCLIRLVPFDSIKNLIVEVYFLVVFGLTILSKLRVISAAHVSPRKALDTIKLWRSLIRKIGYLFLLEKAKKKIEFDGSTVLIDEGFYQVIQNFVTIECQTTDIESLLKYNYQPDLLVVVMSDASTLLARSSSRNDLTRRFRDLDKEDFINIIESSLRNYRELIDRYRKYFNCDVHNLETFTKNHLMLRGIAVVSDTNEKDMHFQ